MKQAIKAGWEQLARLPLRGRVALLAGGALLAFFALVGLLATASLWGPLVLLAALAALCVAGYRQYQKRIPPERLLLIREVSVKAVCFALAGPLPYDIDRPTKQELIVRAKVSRENGADLVGVPLLLLEREPEQVDLKLLHRVFADRLATYSRAPGLGLSPCSQSCPLLALAGVEMMEGEITLRVLITDKAPALAYWRELQTEKQKQRAAAAKPPAHPEYEDFDEEEIL